MYSSGSSCWGFIFLRTPSLRPKISLTYASRTPQQLWEKLVFFKLTRVTCPFIALGISQEPSVIVGQFPDCDLPGQNDSAWLADTRGFKASDCRQPFSFTEPLTYLIPVFFFFLTKLIRIPYIFSNHKSKLRKGKYKSFYMCERRCTVSKSRETADYDTVPVNHGSD